MNRENARPIPLSELTPVVLRELEEAQNRADLVGLSTGVVQLDKITGGLKPGTMLLVGGRPSMGRTALALGMSLHAASCGAAVLFVSGHEVREELVRRLLCTRARVRHALLRGRMLTPEVLESLRRAATDVAGLPIFFHDQRPLCAGDILAQARSLAVRLVVLDDLQAIRAASLFESRADLLAGACYELKEAAGELSATIVVLSQLNRQLERRVDKRPLLSDIRECGAAENVADLVLFLYRDEVYDPDTVERGLAEIIVAKQRGGPVGTVRVRFLHEFTAFEDLT